MPYTHERTLREIRHCGIHMWDRMWDSDVGSDGQQQGLETLGTVHAAETDWENGAFSACTHRGRDHGGNAMIWLSVHRHNAQQAQRTGSAHRHSAKAARTGTTPRQRAQAAPRPRASAQLSGRSPRQRSSCVHRQRP